MKHPIVAAGLAGLMLLAACTSVQPSSPGEASSGTSTSDGSDGEGLRPAVVYPGGSLPDVLARDGRFTTFLALMEVDAFLLDQLLANPQSPFTLFAPTDEAFESLGPRAREAIEADLPTLTGIVERHFMRRLLPADEFVSSFIFTGMSRRASRMALVVDGDVIWFGDANVIETDLAAAGGLIHVIDAVNLGPTPERRPIP